MSIKEQAAKSVFWSAAERFSVQGIQFVLTLVIARILSPEAYGLVAMLGIFRSEEHRLNSSHIEESRMPSSA